MKKAEKDVSRVLRALGNAQPPEGMEARVVARLHARQAEVGTWRGWWRYGCATAAAAMAVLSLAAVLHHDAGKTEAVQAPIMERAVAPMAEVEVPRAVVAVPARKRKVVREVGAQEMRSAPPLPLSEQERMLIALAQRPQLLPELTSIAKTETVTGNGVGGNSIFELASERLQPLQPLQPAPLGDLK